ncbi:amidohydrolase [Lentilactobacillus kefiri]|uniref:Amidohydrolase 3 n=2 Tax=Lentilactobacillus kefiri TaxID=33962 RepID=A0A8E1RJ13_LENKE|nr:amidohydrolase [Lentilactobacillus kefiri]KRL51993.1 amidohydrolase 3 [Lentilactobacillus parakefiri DSM 10551]MDF4143258.1 amidohydrolase [Lactobacillus kefiranofaciens]KRM52402.1 amidohydrolase 3 [Lentilactobacillus kefiri DSM 20587 = JCM 5818]MCJ2161259.1 amidohydrolase [Lentilactobacillus kefiri]PAK59626.1 amidohydrolase [Lentilactobacillus kefiri]
MSTFINGKIFTGADANTFASAMTIKDGQVVWVGDTSDVNDSDAIDLKNQTVLPGLIDVHTHPKYIADALHGVACTPPNVNSIADMQEALRNSPAFGQGPNTWIEGWGFDETKLAEHRTPTVDDLDKVSTTQPIFIYRSDCHSSVGNSKALEMAGITATTPDPVGGFIGHFPDGRPNGYMKEVAATQLLIKAKSAQSYQADVDNMVNSSDHYLKNGIVAIGEMMGRIRPYDSLKLYQDSVQAGFKPKTSIYYVYDEVAGNNRLQPTNDDQLRIAGIKVFMDGSISGETAYNSQPYPSGKQGVSLTNATKLKQAVEYAKQHDLQVAIHAMGDAAIQLILDTTDNMKPWLSDQPSIRIEHASILSDRMLDQIQAATMNYALVTQPIFFFAEDESYRSYLSPEQFKQIYRVKSMMATKAEFALSSDAPCTPWAEPDSPFVNIYAAVTRTAVNGDIVNPSEAINVPDAVFAYTNWPAKIGGFHQNGLLAPGYAGDFVVLDQDIFTIPHNDIKNVRVKETWMVGKRVYKVTK